MNSAHPPHSYILGVRVDTTSYADATQKVVAWTSQAEGRYVCAANVHMVMEAYDQPDFLQVVNNADLVTPDGMPLVWSLRRMGIKDQTRVYGPDLMLHIARSAAEHNIPIGLFGGSPRVVEKLCEVLQRRHPRLQIAYRYSPPFRSLTNEEDEQTVNAINASGARILFVGLGCPKQERWMAEHKAHVRAVMVGVGAAFDIHSGQKPQAPHWMQRTGLEWLFRLLTEPQRLWRRYLYHNPRFLLLMILQLIHH